MWTIFENVPYAFQKNVYFASLGWNVLNISVKSIWYGTLFSAAISLVIFCLEDLSIVGSWVLKSPTIIVLVSISFLKSSKIFLIYLGAPMLGAHMFTMFTASWWIFPLELWNDLLCLFLWPLFEVYIVRCKYCYPSSFSCLFAQNIFFPALHFQSV